MFKILRFAFVAYSVFAIYTATPDAKATMLQGFWSYVNAMSDACTRSDSPCDHIRAAWESVHTQAVHNREAHRPSSFPTLQENQFDSRETRFYSRDPLMNFLQDNAW